MQKSNAAECKLKGTNLKAYWSTTKICDAVVHALRCCIFCIIFLVAIDLKKSVTKATPFHSFIFFMPESVSKPLRVFLSLLLPLPDPYQVLCSIL